MGAGCLRCTEELLPEHQVWAGLRFAWFRLDGLTRCECAVISQ
jgi:hypothetical protein